jgi:endonuclease YncB( thermonuclease family)
VLDPSLARTWRIEVKTICRQLGIAGRSLAALVLGVSLAFAESIAPAGGAPPAGTGPIELTSFVRAVDGDTVDTRIPRGRIAVGIIGIKAPPGNTPCGRQAGDYLQGLLSGSGVRLVEEPGVTFDARSRRLYHVTTGDGQSIAAQMVAAGFARADGHGSNRETLAELEATARAAGRGCLWAGGSR